MAEFYYYLRVVVRWKWTALSFFAIIVLGTALFSFIVTPTYTSTGSIWIEGEPNILPFEDVQRFDASSYLLTQTRLLQSRALAAETIETLKLYENPNFVGNSPVNPSDPISREHLIRAFLKNISVAPIQGTSLVEVSFSNRNPKTAAEVLNVLFDRYVNMIVSQRFQTSEQATQFLKSQIVTVRSEIEDAERKLNAYGSEKDILPLTSQEAPTVTRLADLFRALTEATIDRIKKQDYYNQIKSASLGDIPEAMDNALIQRLREQYANLSGQYARRLATVKPEYPEMQRLQSEIEAARSALKNETENLIRAAFSDYQAALQKEQSLRRLLEQQKSETFKANSNSIFYNSLKIDIDNKKILLDSLLRRQSETGISSRLKDLEAVNIWIVDKADIPLQPTFPNKKRNILVGLLVGLIGGASLALLIEHLNHTVKTAGDVISYSGLSVLGIIPSFEAGPTNLNPRTEFSKLVEIFSGRMQADKRQGMRPKGDKAVPKISGIRSGQSDEVCGRSRIELVPVHDPQSIQAEAYRSIRTTLLISLPPSKIKSILVTSPLPSEGKSATVANLGYVLSQSNKKVAILDSDLRKPRQNEIFESPNGWGITNYISSSATFNDIIKQTRFPNLSLVSSGSIPANPIEILTSDRMDMLIAYLRQNFDYVLLDAPPLLPVSDALAIGPMIDAVILVSRGGRTPLPALKQAKQKLDTHRLKCLGVILNGIDLIDQDGYYARQYYRYSKGDSSASSSEKVSR